MAQSNTTLGRFHLIGIPPAPRGIPQVEVTFEIDANGILNVSAKDLGTGKEQNIKITGSTKLSKEDTDRMINEAEMHAEEDKKLKEKVELRNQADAMVYSAKKVLEEMGDKVSEDTKKSVNEKVEALKKALEKDDTAEMKRIMDELAKEVQKIGTEIYQKTAAQQPPEAGPEQGKDEEPGKKADEVRDADFREVDKE